MHGDHIGGLSGDAGLTFANARCVGGAVEHNHWTAADDEGFNAKVGPPNVNMTLLDDGGSVASDLMAMADYGHPAGHVACRVENNWHAWMLGADPANHDFWSPTRQPSSPGTCGSLRWSRPRPAVTGFTMFRPAFR